MRKILAVVLTFLMMGQSIIFIIKPVQAEEPTLAAILSALGFTNLEESTVETFIPGAYNVTLFAEFANYHASNELSWYVVGTAEYNLIFSGPEGNFGYVDPPIVKSFTAHSKFGLSFLSPEARYFTEAGKNPDGIKHARIYVNLDDPDMFLIGFENLLGGGDKDFNDMVISLKLVTPPIVNIDGKNWYIRNATNNKAFIFLDGGLAPSADGWVYILSFDDPIVNKNQKLPFINEIIQKGFDCLINKDAWYYDGSQTYVKDAATWLKNQGYGHVFLFGFSGGGVVVAYEIQKEYASVLFSAAVVASAPVYWDGHSGIYQSALTAYKVKVTTSAICGETDTFYNQTLLYYNNMVVHKEWHTWEDGHDVFLYTCKDHPGENVSSVALNWYNAAHPPNTPLTPSGATIVHRNEWFVYSTSTIDPNGDNVRYEVEVIGPGINVSAIGEWHKSGEVDTWGVLWETEDPLGNYQMRVRAQDVHGAWSAWSSPLNITVINRAPNTPSIPSGPTFGYVYTTYAYSTSTVDPDGDNVSYQFDWGDGLTTLTGWYASGANASASHSWSRPGTYNVSVRAQDSIGAWSGWSGGLAVSIGQNDAGTGGDAGNSFTVATSISPGSYKGTLYVSNPTDTDDYYKFYAQSGQSIYVSVTPPSSVDFDLQLYDPNGYPKAGSYRGAGYTDSISYTADSTGYWRIRIYIYSGEGQYSFYLSVYWPGGGCPILYVHNGTEYVCEGLLDIHNPDGIDVVYNHTLATAPRRVNGAYLFRLIEHPQTISHIDQVKLYAILEDKTLVELPLIYAWHSEYGNVLPRLRYSDDWKVDEYGANWNNGASQSIDLKFAALNPNMNIIGFIFQIEGNNIIVKV